MSTSPLDPVPRPGGPKVSVIIPTYNRASLLAGAIESVLQQTYRDFEVVVVDDGSTDDTAETLRAYAGRIRFIQQANQGVSAARNTGIRHSTGEWIAFLDSDDTWLPTKLEKQMLVLAEFGPEYGACFSDATLVAGPDQAYSAFDHAGLACSESHGILEEPMPWILARTPAIYIPTLVARRSLVEQCGAFDTQMAVSEDTDLLFKLCLDTRFCFANTRLAELDVRPAHIHSLSSSFSLKEDRFFRSRIHMYDHWLRLLSIRVGLDLYHRVRAIRKSTHYEWLAITIRKLSFGPSYDILHRIRRTGESYPRILLTIVTRATRRTAAALGLTAPAKHPAGNLGKT